MTDEHNMDHLNFIDGVAASDISVLRHKEATYQGSWKRAGGRSAWFMARRNMDRLLTMMAPKEPPGSFNLQNVDDTIAALRVGKFTGIGPEALYAAKFPGSPHATVDIIRHLRDSYIAEDIFASIAAAPTGEDGTVLACIRDLRRYLTLVEAEMVSRGVVITEAPPVVHIVADENLTQKITEELAKPTVSAVVVLDEPLPTAVREYDPQSEPVLLDGMVYAPGAPPRPATPQEKALAHAKTFRADAGGAQSDWPWELAPHQYEAMQAKIKGRVGEPEADRIMQLFWNKMTPTLWRLEPCVDATHIPKELAPYYDHLHVAFGVSTWIIKIQDVPETLRDGFPHLQVEMNGKEFELSPVCYKKMYSSNGDKWILDRVWGAWGREV